MKQTAVEWLVEQLQAPCRGIPSHILEEAKQMEQEQIINARVEAIRDTFSTVNEIISQELKRFPKY